MTFDLRAIIESKRDFRHRLAARPVAEKLGMLDAMRERALAVRPTAKPTGDGNPRGTLKGCGVMKGLMDDRQRERER